jgi:hypothetical protein
MINKSANTIICPKSSFKPLKPISHLVGNVLETKEHVGLNNLSKKEKYFIALGFSNVACGNIFEYRKSPSNKINIIVFIIIIFFK